MISSGGLLLSSSSIHPFSSIIILSSNFFTSCSRYLHLIMDRNSNTKTTLLSPQKRKSDSGQKFNPDWDSAKMDIKRIYIIENNTLKDTMTLIQASHRLQAR
jgi:Clr5 domain